MTGTSGSRVPSTRRPSASASASRCTQVSCPSSAPTAAARPQGQTLQVRSFTKCSSLLGHQRAPTSDRPHAGYAGRRFTGSETWSTTTTTRTLASCLRSCQGRARPWCRALWGRRRSARGGAVGEHTRGRPQGRGCSCASSWEAALPQVVCLDPAGEDLQRLERGPASAEPAARPSCTSPRWSSMAGSTPGEALGGKAFMPMGTSPVTRRPTWPRRCPPPLVTRSDGPAQGDHPSPTKSSR